MNLAQLKWPYLMKRCRVVNKSCLMDYLLDTNIIYGMIKRNPKILSRVAAVTSQNREIFISCITYFEVERGLLAVDSPQQ